MTTEFFQPPARYPFEPGTAVYYVCHGKQSEPPERIPAVVLWVRGSRASIQRADKTRITSARLRHLALRGYCPTCPAPAMVGPDGQLLCSKCGQAAVDMPPPDEFVLRWFPLEEYRAAFLMRRAFQYPGWSYSALSQAAIDAIRAPYDALLERLGLAELYVSHNQETIREELRTHRLMELYAALGDIEAFRATYADLCRLQVRPAAPRRLDRPPLIVDSEDTYLLAQMERQEEKHAPPLALSDTEPDPDHSTAIDAWLDAQFRRAA